MFSANNIPNIGTSMNVDIDTFHEYFDLYDVQVVGEISIILNCVVFELLNKGIDGVIAYDGVEIILLTDVETLIKCEKRDCFFDRDLRYILKKYSKMLLEYNKNYNEFEGI